MSISGAHFVSVHVGSGSFCDFTLANFSEKSLPTDTCVPAIALIPNQHAIGHKLALATISAVAQLFSRWLEPLAVSSVPIMHCWSDVAVRQGSSTSRRRAVRRSRDDAGELRARKRKGRGTSEMKPFALGVSRNLRQSRYRVSVVEHIWAGGSDRRRGPTDKLGAASRLTFASDLARVGCPPLPARSGRPPVAQRRAQRMHILRVTGVNTAGRVADAVSCFDDVPGGTDLVPL